MYRIQAHNIRTRQIEVFKCNSSEYFALVASLKETGDYGMIEAEYLSRY